MCLVSVKIDFIPYQQRIDKFLETCLPDAGQLLHKAMHYSVLGGKRLRPLLVYRMGEALNIPLEKLDHAAGAVELMHAYSLIHDDLPVMDDDDWRRGKPSCHKEFNEAIALLAGDALQALAFEVLSNAKVSAIQKVRMLQILAKAVGYAGMVGGQAMEFDGLVDSSYARLETINGLKTGALFRACLEWVGVVGNVSADSFSALARFGTAIGQCYQLQDDICDNEVAFNDLTMLRATSQQHLLISVQGLPLEEFSKQLLTPLLSFLLPKLSIDKIY